jgi:hypothetical protein
MSLKRKAKVGTILATLGTALGTFTAIFLGTKQGKKVTQRLMKDVRNAGKNLKKFAQK